VSSATSTGSRRCTPTWPTCCTRPASCDAAMTHLKEGGPAVRRGRRPATRPARRSGRSSSGSYRLTLSTTVMVWPHRVHGELPVQGDQAGRGHGDGHARAGGERPEDGVTDMLPASEGSRRNRIADRAALAVSVNFAVATPLNRYQPERAGRERQRAGGRRRRRRRGRGHGAGCRWGPGCCWRRREVGGRATARLPGRAYRIRRGTWGPGAAAAVAARAAVATRPPLPTRAGVAAAVVSATAVMAAGAAAGRPAAGGGRCSTGRHAGRRAGSRRGGRRAVMRPGDDPGRDGRRDDDGAGGRGHRGLRVAAGRAAMVRPRAP